jgi:hypothetical protein
VRIDRPSTGSPLRWGRALAWIAAWALVVAAGYFAPLWVAIALAIGVFGAQILLAPGCAPGCSMPKRVTDHTPPSAP